MLHSDCPNGARLSTGSASFAKRPVDIGFSLDKTEFFKVHFDLHNFNGTIGAQGRTLSATDAFLGIGGAYESGSGNCFHAEKPFCPSCGAFRLGDRILDILGPLSAPAQEYAVCRKI